MAAFNWLFYLQHVPFFNCGFYGGGHFAALTMFCMPDMPGNSLFKGWVFRHRVQQMPLLIYFHMI